MTGLSRGVAVVIVLVGWAGACQRSSGGRPSDSAGDGMGVASPGKSLGVDVSAIRLERRACYGKCPVYVLDVDSMGRVRFEGRAHVRVVGEATGTIARQAFRDMTATLLESGFPSFRASYVDGGPDCGDHVTDAPVVILSAVIDGTPKQVVHDYGCYGAPRVLRRLHQMVDSVVNTSRWIRDS